MKTVLKIAVLVMALPVCLLLQAAENNSKTVDVISLGKSKVTDTPAAEAAAVYPKKGKAIKRSFAEQPPLIPHKVSYKITLRRNSCLSCHSWKKAKRRKATPIAKSHVIDSKGKLNKHNYFCTQCHIPQASNTSSLVDNTFTPQQ